MKNIAPKLTALFTRILFVIFTIVTPFESTSAGALSIPRELVDSLTDPLFGIEFRPSQIHFQRAPDEVFRCKELSERRGNLFLFGKVVKHSTRYYLVSGWVEAQPDGPPDTVRHFEDEGDGGIIIAATNASCKFIGAGYALSPDERFRRTAREQVGITDEILDELINDSLEREIRAFGGREQFLCMAVSSNVDRAKLPAQLAAKMDKLGRIEGKCETHSRR